MDILHYLKIPYKPQGRSFAEGLDCWGLVMKFYQDHYNVELPGHPIDPIDIKLVFAEFKTVSLYPVWVETQKPELGDIVVAGRGKFFHHAGIYLGDAQKSILHTHKDTGFATTMPLFRFKQQWPLVKFYNYDPRRASQKPI
jgi:cell wall-associated NlpC family hydrolase